MIIDKIWDDFIHITNDENTDKDIEPLYYLKLYAINRLNNKSELIQQAKKDYISSISSNIIEGDQVSLYCICDYLINCYNITNKEEIIDILLNLNLENLNIIASSSNSLLYKKMKKNISNLKENDVTNFIKPLISALNNLSKSYENYYTNVVNKIKNKILELYNNIFNKKFECYIINNKNTDTRIYIYENGMVIRYNINNEYIDCIYNYLNKLVIKKIKKYISSNPTEFDKFSKLIIKKGEIFDSMEKAMKNQEKYLLYSDLLGEFEVIRNEDTDKYYYKIICEKLKFNNIKNNIYIIGNKDYKKNKIKDIDLNKIVKKVERLFEIQEDLIEKYLNSIVDMCDQWKETDKNNNKITLEYVKEHISPLEVSIDIDEIQFCIEALLESDKEDEDFLLGEHSLILTSGEYPKEAIFKLMG